MALMGTSIIRFEIAQEEGLQVMASCYGLILAGGLYSRMGTDKVQLHRNGQAMLEYSQTLLESLGLDVLISGSEQGIPDLFPELGPLAGIYTTVKYCESENLGIDAITSVIPVIGFVLPVKVGYCFV